MKRILTIFLFIVSLSAIADENVYQIHETKDGKILRLNKQTGALYLVEGDSLVSLYDKTVVLKIGSYYEMEDGKKEARYLKYLGNGKFEKSKVAILSIK